MDTSTMLSVGTMLHNGTYRIDAPLSLGGFGHTYRVHHVAFNEVYAVKEFFMQAINSRNGNEVSLKKDGDRVIFESQLAKFKKEALRLRRLSSNHIVRVHDLFEENGTAYYIMDYIDGASVDERLKQSAQPFSEDEVWTILPQLLDALKTVHSQQMWHLDIKPGNIMLDNENKAYLIDFGASKQMLPDSGQNSTLLAYTPGYAPMEQVEHDMDKFGPWTDFYSLGATLYKMLTQRQPPSTTELTEGGKMDFSTGVSRQMQSLIRWMMSPQRNRRPQSVQEIESFLGWDTPKPQTASPLSGNATILNSSPKAEKGRNKLLWNTSLAVIMGLLLGFAVYFLFFSRPSTSLSDEDEDYVENAFSVTMHGYVDQYPVTMSLDIEGNVVKGSYFYKRHADSRLLLMGTYDNGYIDLNETTVDGLPTGHFRGQMTKKHDRYQGEFINTKGESLSFSVSK